MESKVWAGLKVLAGKKVGSRVAQPVQERVQSGRARREGGVVGIRGQRGRRGEARQWRGKRGDFNAPKRGLGRGRVLGRTE